VEVTMDLSNRPCITHNLSLSSNPNNEEYAGDLSVEMLDHVLESLVINSKFTVHFVEREVGSTVRETALAAACAYGKALRMCAAVDLRRAGKTASSKGTLSV
jgi:imidazoleglycerol-phosphate dehydratase